MRQIQVVKKSEVVAMVERISVAGTIEIGQLMTAIQALEKEWIIEESVFSRVDEQNRIGGWPPDGKW